MVRPNYIIEFSETANMKSKALKIFLYYKNKKYTFNITITLFYVCQRMLCDFKEAGHSAVTTLYSVLQTSPL